MSAKHKRPFYIFAAVAVVCSLVLVSGIRSGGDKGRDTHLVTPALTDPALTQQSDEIDVLGVQPGSIGGKGRATAVQMVQMMMMIKAQQVAEDILPGHVPGSITGDGEVPELPGPDDLGDIDDPGDPVQVRGHEDDGTGDEQQQSNEPNPPDETDEPATPDETDEPDDPETTPESDPTEPTEPVEGGDNFSDLSTENPGEGQPVPPGAGG